MTQNLKATIMVKQDGKTKKGDPSIKLQFAHLDDPIWAFKWAV